MTTDLPETLSRKMKLWRMGLGILPPEYIRFNERLAEKELIRLKSEGQFLVVHRSWMEADGWLDGMRVLHAVVEDCLGNLLKLAWHDGNQEFFVKIPNSGSIPLRLYKG